MSHAWGCLRHMVGDYHGGEKKKTMMKSGEDGCGDGKEKGKQVQALCGRAVLEVWWWV